MQFAHIILSVKGGEKMLRSEVNQPMLLQNTKANNTSTSKDNIKRNSSFSNENNEFNKVLASRKEKYEDVEKPKVQSKESSNIEKQDPIESKTAEENDKVNGLEENNSKDIKEDEVETLEEETMLLSELNAVIEDLIGALQSNVIDIEKLESLMGQFEDIISKLDLGDSSLDLGNLQELKALLVNLELVSREALNTANDNKVSDELQSLTQLVEDTSSSIDETLVKVDGNRNLIENGEDKALLETDVKGEALVDGESQSEAPVKVNTSNESSNNPGSSADDLNNGFNNNEGGQSIEVKDSRNIEAKNEEKDLTQSSDSKVSSEDSVNMKSEAEASTKKNLNTDLVSEKEVDPTNIRNFQIEDFKGYEVSEASKPLGGSQQAKMDIFNQIIEAAKVSISEDTSEMIMKLKPDNLGKLSMKLVVERGMLVAEFEVESQIVKEAIESNLEDLRNALRDKGFQIQDLNVSVNQDSNSNENQHLYFNNNRKTKKMSLIDSSKKQDVYVSNQYNMMGSSTINFLA